MNSEEIKSLLGLEASATDDDVRQAIAAGRDALALRNHLASSLALHTHASDVEIVAGLQAAQSDAVTHMRNQIVTMSEEVRSLREATARDAAEAFVAEKGREYFISEPARDSLIQLHMRSSGEAAALVVGFQKIPKSPFGGAHRASRDVTGGGPNSSAAREIRSRMA